MGEQGSICNVVEQQIFIRRELFNIQHTKSSTRLALQEKLAK